MMNENDEDDNKYKNECTVAQRVEQFVADKTCAPPDMRGALSALKLIPHFLSADECAFFRRLVRRDSGERVQQLLNRKRLIFDSEIVAEWFWNRLHAHNAFPSVRDEYGDEWVACGINERFRLVRYDQGEQFLTHQDGFYWPQWNKRTFATAMVYLNNMPLPHTSPPPPPPPPPPRHPASQNNNSTHLISLNSDENDGKGVTRTGATRFHDIHTVVEPAEGLLVAFLVDDLLHCGEPCAVEKYLLRTDIFYELRLPDDEEQRRAFATRRRNIFAEFECICN